MGDTTEPHFSAEELAEIWRGVGLDLANDVWAFMEMRIRPAFELTYVQNGLAVDHVAVKRETAALLRRTADVLDPPASGDSADAT